jgi:hypothetical protein
MYRTGAFQWGSSSAVPLFDGFTPKAVVLPRSLNIKDSALLSLP